MTLTNSLSTRPEWAFVLDGLTYNKEPVYTIRQRDGQKHFVGRVHDLRHAKLIINATPMRSIIQDLLEKVQEEYVEGVRSGFFDADTRLEELIHRAEDILDETK